MAHKPILFSTPMVQAILNGNKTQTRREIKTKKPLYLFVENGIAYGTDNNSAGKEIKCPYGQPGDILWVRETWAKVLWFEYGAKTRKPHTHYKADGDFIGEHKWKPSIHMPKEACRIFLRIKDIRVERLQDITEKDAIAEGIQAISGETEAFKDYLQNLGSYATARGSYFSLWMSINGQTVECQNPWVWVIEFERCDKPADF